MNAIVISAVWGVIMMFSGLLNKRYDLVRALSLIGLGILFIANIAEMQGYRFIQMDVRNMLIFDSFGLLFNAVALGATMIFFLLSGRDIQRVGIHVAEYYALIFFILAGVAVASSFNSLLMLFLGIEIISIPLYILSGADKRNLKSNEASLKYLLMGAFSTGLMLMGIALIYGAKGSFNLEIIDAGSGTLTP